MRPSIYAWYKKISESGWTYKVDPQQSGLHSTGFFSVGDMSSPPMSQNFNELKVRIPDVCESVGIVMRGTTLIVT
jgi:hypothetical protein